MGFSEKNWPLKHPFYPRISLENKGLFSFTSPPLKSKKTKTKKHFYAWNYWKSFSQTRIKSSSSNSVILPLVTKKNIANTSLLIRKKKKKKAMLEEELAMLDF